MTLAIITALGSPFHTAKASEPARSQTLQQIARKTMKFHFLKDGKTSLEDFVESIPVQPRYEKPAGVFVTLSKDGKTRACWGSVFPEHDNLVKSTAYATVAALTSDYRYPPVRGSEADKLHAQVTVINRLNPISNISSINPLKHGLMIRSGGRSAVILPGEARDAHYQLVQCRLKAGIKEDEPYQLYRITAEIYE